MVGDLYFAPLISELCKYSMKLLMDLDISSDLKNHPLWKPKIPVWRNRELPAKWVSLQTFYSLP